MKVCAVIDTNVIVSALITKNSQSPPCMVLREVLDGRITPLFHASMYRAFHKVLYHTFSSKSVALPLISHPSGCT